jgi:hypothetical protein
MDYIHYKRVRGACVGLQLNLVRGIVIKRVAQGKKWCEAAVPGKRSVV